jgi:hypothetical protein
MGKMKIGGTLVIPPVWDKPRLADLSRVAKRAAGDENRPAIVDEHG